LSTPSFPVVVFVGVVVLQTPVLQTPVFALLTKFMRADGQATEVLLILERW